MTIAEQRPERKDKGNNNGGGYKPALIAAVAAIILGGFVIRSRMETPTRLPEGPTYTDGHFVDELDTLEGFSLNDGADTTNIEHVPVATPAPGTATEAFEPPNPNIDPIHRIIDLTLDPVGGEPVLDSDPALRQIQNDAQVFVNSPHPIERTQEFQEFLQVSGDFISGTLFKGDGTPATFEEASVIAKEERITGDTFSTQRLADAYLNHMQQRFQDGTITEDQLAVLELMNEYYREATGYYLATSAVLDQLATLYGIGATIDPSTTISWDNVDPAVKTLLLTDSPAISKELLYFLEELAKNGGMPMTPDWIGYFQYLQGELSSDTQDLWEVWDSRTATPAIQSNQ